MAKVASEALGHKVEYKQVSDQEAASILGKATNLDPHEQALLLEMYDLTHKDAFDHTSADLINLIHKITTLHDFFGMYKQEFTS